MITHPEKVLFPDDGITKGELAAYYEAIAPVMLPHIVGRPVTMERFHRGIGAPGFFQKNVVKGFPEWLERVEVPKNDGSVHHPVVRDTRSLLWLANQNSITPHVWTSRAPNIMKPDICVFDLDPPTTISAGYARQRFFARRLDELGLSSWVKTSGSKDSTSSSHSTPQRTTVPWRALRTASASSSSAEIRRIHAGVPQGGPRRAHPRGHWAQRVQRDVCRGVRSPRQPGAPVSAPCTWAEIEQSAVEPRTFTLRNMAASPTSETFGPICSRQSLLRLERDRDNSETGG